MNLKISESALRKRRSRGAHQVLGTREVVLVLTSHQEEDILDYFLGRYGHAPTLRGHRLNAAKRASEQSKVHEEISGQLAWRLQE